MSYIEEYVQAELVNIVKNAPLWPGDTISHEASYECVRRGLARRNRDSNFVPTLKGCALAPVYLLLTRVRSAIRAAREG